MNGWEYEDSNLMSDAILREDTCFLTCFFKTGIKRILFIVDRSSTVLDAMLSFTHLSIFLSFPG
jgi:hypothetical protein